MNLPPLSTLKTFSNGVSIFRLLLTVPIALSIAADALVTSFVLCWIAAVTDWLDGAVARKTDTVSEWGKILDPVADKVLVGTVVIMLVLKGLLPMWFTVAVVVRDLIIVAGSSYASRYTDKVLPSLMSGKLAVSAVAFTGVMAMIHQPLLVEIGVWTSCFLMVLSLYDYKKRLNGIIRQV